MSSGLFALRMYFLIQMLTPLPGLRICDLHPNPSTQYISPRQRFHGTRAAPTLERRAVGLGLSRCSGRRAKERYGVPYGKAGQAPPPGRSFSEEFKEQTVRL